MDDGRAETQRTPIDVIIADDHSIVRDGIRSVLEREEGEFEVVAEAGDIPLDGARGPRAQARPADARPDDAGRLEPRGAALRCFIAHPTLAVAILTMREDPEYARQALRAGARSYVLKEAEPAELLQAFRTAVAGGNYLHPRLGALMATGENGGERRRASRSASARREVIRLIADGFTNPEIAEQLKVAERTVKTYRARAIEKLGISSRAEITAYVRRSGPRSRLSRRRRAGARDSGTVRRTSVPAPGAGQELELAADQLGALAHPRHPEAALEAVAAGPEALAGVGQAPCRRR